MNTDGLDFEMRFIRSEIVRVNWRKFDTMMNEKSEPTASIIIWTVASKQRIIRECWIFRGRFQLSLLNTRNFNAVLLKKRGEFTLARLNSVGVEL